MKWEIIDSKCVSDGVATIRGITCLIQNIISPLPGIIILAALAMVIWSGIRMISAGADAKSYSNASNTFYYAVVGLILLSGAWLLLIIIKNLTGADVTNFGIPTPTP
jgi:hypothetical protein